jgi:hypothetical protein
MNVQVMRCTLDTSTKLVLFGKLDGSLNILNGLGLYCIYWNEPLVARCGHIIVDITIAISIFPSYQVIELSNSPVVACVDDYLPVV